MRVYAFLFLFISYVQYLALGLYFLLYFAQVIEFSELDKTKVTFLRQILSRLLVDAEADDLAVIFGK